MRAARRLAIVLAGIGLLAGPVAPSQATLTPTKVIATSADEYAPAASADFIAWVQWNGQTKSNIVYAQDRIVGAPFRVNALHTEGWLGAIDGTTLVYQQFSQKTGVSDIYLFDLVTKERTPIDPAINSRRWEYSPSMSGDWVMFARWFPSGDRKLILFNLLTHESRPLDASSGNQRSLSPGQVSGQYATFGRWAWNARTTTSCEVFLHDITANATEKITNPRSKCQYASSVNPAGTVFYARAGFYCGQKVTLRQLPISGAPTTLVDLPDGRDFGNSYALDNGDATTDVFFDPARCGRKANIVKVTAP